MPKIKKSNPEKMVWRVQTLGMGMESQILTWPLSLSHHLAMPFGRGRKAGLKKQTSKTQNPTINIEYAASGGSRSLHLVKLVWTSATRTLQVPSGPKFDNIEQQM